MPADWDGVDSLIRELGAIRAAADTTRAAHAASEAVEAAIAVAALAIGDTIGAPKNSAALSHAHQTIASARALVSTLATEMERARKARLRAFDLGVLPPRRRPDRAEDPD
jgi:hypothetical protein